MEEENRIDKRKKEQETRCRKDEKKEREGRRKSVGRKERGK